jgi:hypothetical protein
VGVSTPDPNTITAPVLASPPGEPPWYVFPAAWSSDLVDEWLALQAELAREQDQLEQLRAEAAAAAHSADAVLAAARAEIAKVRTERERAERDQAEKTIFDELVAKYGRVGRVDTCEGAIFLRPMLDTEVDRTEQRIGGVPSMVDKVKIARDALAQTVVHPSRDRFAERVSRYPGLWGPLYEERDRLIDGRAEVAKGKG